MKIVTDRTAVRAILAERTENGFVRVGLNGQDLWIPVETLNTVIHCVHEEDGALLARVETQHFNWMRDRLKPGMHFVDVGAATGTVLLPILRHFGSSICAVAFEPRAIARDLIVSAVERNGLPMPHILPMAVSDAPGSAIFNELPNDSTDEVPYLSECSTLAPNADPRAREMTVDVTTLDGLPLHGVSSAVVKIDVEGYETKVLQGATQFLRRARPWLSIDIHNDPTDASKTTEADVRDLLTPLGYTFDKLLHVLLCSPPHRTDIERKPKASDSIPFRDGVDPNWIRWIDERESNRPKSS